MFAADHMKRNNAWDEFHNHNQNHPHHNHNHSHVHPPYNGGGGHQSDSGAHLIPIHVMDPSAQYTRKYKNLHHFPNPSADHSMSGRSYSPPMMDLPMGGMGMGMDMDMDSPNFNPGGFPPSMTSTDYDYDYPGKSQQIHKIEIPSCFRQAEETQENGAKGGGAPNSNSNGTKINGGPPPPIDIHGGSCPQAQALYNNFMEQQQNQQQQQSPNPNSSSSNTTPLNSPGFNSGIRHIPIFFEGKVKNGVNQNNNNNSSSQNNNVNNNNQSSSQSKNNSINNNNNAKEQLKSAPIPLPPPASIPIPVRSGKSPEERKFSYSTSPPRSPAEDGVKPPPRQKNCVNNNNNNNANNNNNSDESAQPPLKKPTPTPQTTTVPNQNNNNNTSAEIPIPIPVVKGQSSNNSSGSSSPVKTPLERVQLISEDVRKLEKDVQEFQGNSKTKEYLYLDEMLTRNLLRLDDICVEGQIEVRMARKECINLVNNCIQKLEAKLEKNDSNNNNNSSGGSTGRELVPVDQNQIVKIPGGDKSKNNGSLSSSCKGGTPFFHRSEVNLVVNGEN